MSKRLKRRKRGKDGKFVAKGGLPAGMPGTETKRRRPRRGPLRRVLFFIMNQVALTKATVTDLLEALL